MKRFLANLLVLMMLLSLPTIAAAMSITHQFPTFVSHMVLTVDPMIVIFDQSLDTSSVDDDSFYVTLLGDTDHIDGNINIETTNLTNDTVVFTATADWPWATRLQLHITSDVTSNTGDPFNEVLDTDGIFVANIPNDFEIPVLNPQDPLGMFVDSTVLMGFNPVEPEADAQPWEIPGLNVTGAWKYTNGNPNVLVAIIDNGVRDYDRAEIRRAFFLNAGELPLPNVAGTPCTEYDCNEDGRFDVEDYAQDDRLDHGDPVTATDLIETFSDEIDQDDNGLVDDISGWDFMRNTNVALGVEDFPEGTHGDGEMRLIVSRANDNSGNIPGICPDCMVLPIRASSVLIYDYNTVAAGVRYALSMGASILNFAGVNFTWSEASHQGFVDAYDTGQAVTIAASGDEMTFHHWMPAAGEDVISVKTIFPMVPVDLIDMFNLSMFGFTETYCTNYGTHTHLSVPAKTGCTSDSTGNTTGMMALLLSYAHEQGIDLTADEAKQLLTMTADDVKNHCATMVNLLGVCQEGYDMHFGYGRPNLEAAMLSLGDPDFGIGPTIPPTVRITSPAWWEDIDPAQTSNLPVYGQMDSRVTPYRWELQIAKGHEPKENEWETVATGREHGPVDDLIATIPVDSLFTAEQTTGVPENQYSFEFAIRLRAYYQDDLKGQVLGEARKSINLHTDDDPATGMVPGFPLRIGASGESSPMLYDLDGAEDQRLEIVFGTADGTVVALKYNNESETWGILDGFPIDLSGDDAWVSDSIFASVAIGDLFGDGQPEIVAATMRGKVYAIDPETATVLDGFPVSAEEPDNSSAFAFGHGNSFAASPVLADLDLDGRLEIIAASFDQYVYVWRLVGDKGTPQLMSGWPVLCRSEEGSVPPAKVCQGNDNPSLILGTPAVGIIDPNSDDEHVSQYPSVIVATTETCDGVLIPDTRVYAIYHDGDSRQDGPFLPGWPVNPIAPLGDALPIPILVGAASSPAVAVTPEATYIGVGSMAWFPQIVTYANGKTNVDTLIQFQGVNAVGSPSFSSLRNDGTLQLVAPLLGVLKYDELGVNLFNSKVVAMEVEKPHDLVLTGRVEDMPVLVTQTTADLDNNGTREVVAGSGGYLAHAFALGDNNQAPGWPKYTQKWIMAAPAVGDLDADGKLEVVIHTREGVLFAWESEGQACVDNQPNSDWRRFHHDEHNTGFYGYDNLPPIRIVDLIAEQLDNGRIRLTFTAPGNDWQCGMAARYSVRYTTDSAADLTDPEQFAVAAIVEDVPSPLSGGQEQTFEVEADNAAVFAIVTIDADGNISRISNNAPVTEASDDDATPDDDDDDNDTLDDDVVDDDVADDDDDDNDDGCGC